MINNIIQIIKAAAYVTQREQNFLSILDSEIEHRKLLHVYEVLLLS